MRCAASCSSRWELTPTHRETWISEVRKLLRRNGGWQKYFPEAWVHVGKYPVPQSPWHFDHAVQVYWVLVSILYWSSLYSQPLVAGWRCYIADAETWGRMLQDVIVLQQAYSPICASLSVSQFIDLRVMQIVSLSIDTNNLPGLWQHAEPHKSLSTDTTCHLQLRVHDMQIAWQRQFLARVVSVAQYAR